MWIPFKSIGLLWRCQQEVKNGLSIVKPFYEVPHKVL